MEEVNRIEDLEAQRYERFGPLDDKQRATLRHLLEGGSGLLFHGDSHVAEAYSLLSQGIVRIVVMRSPAGWEAWSVSIKPEARPLAMLLAYGCHRRENDERKYQ